MDKNRLEDIVATCAKVRKFALGTCNGSMIKVVNLLCDTLITLAKEPCYVPISLPEVQDKVGEPTTDSPVPPVKLSVAKSKKQIKANNIKTTDKKSDKEN